MSMEGDLKWYLERRRELACTYNGQWLVILNGEVVKSFSSEVAAIECSVAEYGVEVASVLQATEEDPVTFVG